MAKANGIGNQTSAWQLLWIGLWHGNIHGGMRGKTRRVGMWFVVLWGSHLCLLTRWWPGQNIELKPLFSNRRIFCFESNGWNCDIGRTRLYISFIGVIFSEGLIGDKTILTQVMAYDKTATRHMNRCWPSCSNAWCGVTGPYCVK